MNAVLSFLNETRKTTETKAILVAALWAASSAVIPGVPLMLPPMDFGGMGTLTVSPAVLIAIALVNVIKKVGTDGATPFLPSELATKEANPDA